MANKVHNSRLILFFVLILVSYQGSIVSGACDNDWFNNFINKPALRTAFSYVYVDPDNEEISTDTFLTNILDEDSKVTETLIEGQSEIYHYFNLHFSTTPVVIENLELRIYIESEKVLHVLDMTLIDSFLLQGKFSQTELEGFGCPQTSENETTNWNCVLKVEYINTCEKSIPHIVTYSFNVQRGSQSNQLITNSVTKPDNTFTSTCQAKLVFYSSFDSDQDGSDYKTNQESTGPAKYDEGDLIHAYFVVDDSLREPITIKHIYQLQSDGNFIDVVGDDDTKIKNFENGQIEMIFKILTSKPFVLTIEGFYNYNIRLNPSRRLAEASEDDDIGDKEGKIYYGTTYINMNYEEDTGSAIRGTDLALVALAVIAILICSCMYISAQAEKNHKITKWLAPVPLREESDDPVPESEITEVTPEQTAQEKYREQMLLKEFGGY